MSHDDMMTRLRLFLRTLLLIRDGKFDVETMEYIISKLAHPLLLSVATIDLKKGLDMLKQVVTEELYHAGTVRYTGDYAQRLTTGISNCIINLPYNSGDFVKVKLLGTVGPFLLSNITGYIFDAILEFILNVRDRADPWKLYAKL